MTSLHDHIISATVKRLEDPQQFLTWSEALDNAERTGRIKRAKRSPLAYCLERFAMSALTTDDKINPDLRLYLNVDDVAMTVEWRNPHEANSDGVAEVALPEWVYTFFEQEDHAALLDKDNPEKLGEVLQQVYEHCIQEGYIEP